MTLQIDSGMAFTDKGLMELLRRLEPFLLGRHRGGGLGGGAVQTPPLTHDYGTGAISGPTVVDPDVGLTADVSLTSTSQFTVSELFAGVTGGHVPEAAFYGQDWIVRVGDESIIYLSNVEILSGDDTTFFRTNEQVTLGDDSNATGDNIDITAGTGANLIIHNGQLTADSGTLRIATELATVAGVGSTVGWADHTITGNTGAAAHGLLLKVRAYDGGNASGLEVQVTAQEGGTGRGLFVFLNPYLTAPDLFLAADFEDGPVLLGPLTDEPPDPSAYASLINQAGGSLYVYDNAGTKELRTNVNGVVTVLAIG